MLVLKTTSPRASPCAPAATPRYHVPSSRARTAFIAWVVGRESWVGGRASGLRPGVIVTYGPVLPQSGVSATGTRFPVDIRVLPWIKPLAADYAFEFHKLAPFFAGDPSDAAAWRDTIARVQKRERDRD